MRANEDINTIDIEMLNDLPGLIFICVDPPGYTLTFISKGCKSLSGYAPEELTGRNITEVIHPDDTEELKRLTASTVAVGLPLESAFRIIAKDGTVKSLWTYSRAIDTDDEGMPSVFISFCVDISRLLRIEDSQRSNRSTFDFLSKISRNIRTPLNAVLGMTELGLREDMPYKVREYTRTVQQAGEGLITVLNDILEFASIESGEIEIQPEEYSLSALLNDMKCVTEQLIGPNSALKFEIDVQDNIPDLLFGDETKLRRVIFHLLSNAVKFTETGLILLEVDGVAEGDNLTLTITVEDSGRGIVEEDLDNIFKEFIQLDTKNIEGTGIGLPITRSLVKLMGGEIQASSVYGVGSIFSVTVTQGIVSHDKMCTAGDTGNLRGVDFIAPEAKVLIVDDIELNLRITAGLLNPYKMQIDICKSGMDAIESVKSKGYDLIFMDHLMPIMDGVEAVYQIRTMGFAQEDIETDCKNVPIIALTANATQSAKEMFLENGFSDYLAKPVDISQLNTIIEKWVPEEKRQIRKTSQADAKGGAGIEITGINTAKGFAMAGSNLDNYLSILKDYYAYSHKLLKEFKTCLEKGDLETYRIHAHSLKSASGSIGADRLYIASEAFESAAKNGDITFIKDNGPKFFGELGILLQNIHPFIKNLSEAAVEYNASVSGKPRILLIDDSPPVLNLLIDILKEDYTLLLAKDGGLGLSTAKESVPDLIILDLTMPGISGLDVLKSLKADEATKGITVILISGNDSYESQIEGYSLGAVEFIRKPFARDILKHRVDFNIRHVLLERGLTPSDTPLPPPRYPLPI